MQYDLEERTARFGETVIQLVLKIKITSVNKRIIEQLVGSAGSIGANYCEANGSESKKDFIHKIRISTKEIKETKHWLRMLATAEPEHKDGIRKLSIEVLELLKIFITILKSSRNNVN